MIYKMKRALLLSALLTITVLPLCARSGTFENAFDAVRGMKVGWNLSNTLDAHSNSATEASQSEFLRNQPLTEAGLLEMLKDAGFNAVRVPVTWYPHMDSNGNIDARWMARVRAIVDYVIAQGMYCIINVHHDTGKSTADTPKKGWLKADINNYNQQREKFEALWTQIATEFKDYGELLLFEGYNELLDSYDSWNYASFGTSGKWDANVAASAYSAINQYAQSFVNTVRNTGGNNTQRNLIINTYAAADGRGNWSTHNQDPLKELVIPTDNSTDHLIVQVHTYPPIVDTDESGYIMDDRDFSAIKTDIDRMISALNTHVVAKGVPVIFGEWGTSNVDTTPSDYDARRTLMFRFADYLVKTATANNMATFYWSGLSDKTDRSLPAFTQADLADVILKAYYGNDYQPALPTREDYTNIYYTANYTQRYGEAFLMRKGENTGEYASLELELNSAPRLGTDLRYVTYSSDNSELANPYINRITTTIPLNNNISHVTLKFQKFNFYPVQIKHIWLVKLDGTKVEVTPSRRGHCWIGAVGTPAFIKQKIGNTLYATLYHSDKNLRVPEGVTAQTYKVTNGKLQEVRTYVANDVIPAGTGVVLNSTNAQTYLFSLSDASGEEAIGNMLRGSDEQEMTTGGGRYYKLSLNKNNEPNTIGFYYGAPDGAAFLNGAHKAYLAVPDTEARMAQFPFSEVETVNGIEEIPTLRDDTNNAWYTLDGRRLPRRPVVQGIYITAGKKVVVP